MSDLHLDSGPPGYKFGLEVHPQAEVLVVAGDLVENDLSYLDGVFDYVKIPTLIVPGNHEYMRSNIDEVVPRLKKYFEDTNVHVLSRDSITINDVLFVGATLWTPLDTEHCQLNPGWVNDCVGYHDCKGLTSTRWVEEFYKDYDFIKATLETEEPYKKSVVITHFMPLLKCIPERFRSSNMNAFYASDNCEKLIYWSNAPDVWIHGHTHDSITDGEYSTRIYCNPLGIYRPSGQENTQFNPQLLIEV